GRSGGPSWHWSAAPAECRRRSSPRLQSLELRPRMRSTRLSLQSCLLRISSPLIPLAAGPCRNHTDDGYMDIVRGSLDHSHGVGPDFVAVGRAKSGRLRDTRLVHRASSGEQEVPDFI